jgi:hypothetical protein
VHIILADREAEFMEVLWRLGPSTVAEVRNELADKLAYIPFLQFFAIWNQKDTSTTTQKAARIAMRQ